MPTVLHLHGDVFPARSQAIQVKDNPPVIHVVRIVLLIDKRQILDVMLPRKQFVQQGDEQFLAGWLPEDDFETDIRKRIYKVSIFFLLSSCLKDRNTWGD